MTADPARKLAILFAICAMAAPGLVMREGWVLKAYPDPVHGNSVPTACAGVTEGVKPGQTFTVDECVTRTAIAMVKHIGPIMPCVRDDVTAQLVPFLSEMGSMSYNVGVGRERPPSGFLSSTMCREMKAGNYRAACDGILLWWKSNGRDCRVDRSCRGLWADRQRQHARCLKALA